MVPMGGHKRWTYSLFIFLTLVVLLSPAVSAEEEGKTKVAIINGSAIGKDEFDREMKIFRGRYRDRLGSLKDSEMLAVKKKILEGIIERELLFQESKRSCIRVEDGTIREQLAKIKQQYPNEETFKEVIKRVNLTEEQVIFQIRKGLSIQRLISERFDKIEVTEVEAKAYYDTNKEVFKAPEEVRASHILIKTDPGMDASKRAEARNKIEKVRERLHKGEDFAELAKEVSEGPSRSRGGDLGYFRKGQMVKAFEDVSFAMEPGQVSDIVETRFGYHIIKVTGRRPEKVVEFDDVKSKLKDYLKSRKIQEGVNKLVASLKEKAEIERFIP